MSLAVQGTGLCMTRDMQPPPWRSNRTNKVLQGARASPHLRLGLGQHAGAEAAALGTSQGPGCDRALLRAGGPAQLRSAVRPAGV